MFFFVVKPLNVLQERRRRGEEPPAEELSDEAVLLTEIRDLLRQPQGVPAPAGAARCAPPAAPRPAPAAPTSRRRTTGW